MEEYNQIENVTMKRKNDNYCFLFAGNLLKFLSKTSQLRYPRASIRTSKQVTVWLSREQIQIKNRPYGLQVILRFSRRFFNLILGKTVLVLRVLKEAIKL